MFRSGKEVLFLLFFKEGKVCPQYSTIPEDREEHHTDRNGLEHLLMGKCIGDHMYQDNGEGSFHP